MEIIGDSIVNGVNPRGFDKKYLVKVRPYGGATSEDVIDFVKPSVRKKPDHMLIHVGTNDLTNKVDTIKQSKTIIKYIKENSPTTQICMSSITIRADKKGLDSTITKINNDLMKFCKNNDIAFIDNSNVNSSHLSRKKLHLNQKGLSVLANNFITYLNTTKK